MLHKSVGIKHLIIKTFQCGNNYFSPNSLSSSTIVIRISQKKMRQKILKFPSPLAFFGAIISSLSLSVSSRLLAADLLIMIVFLIDKDENKDKKKYFFYYKKYKPIFAFGVYRLLIRSNKTVRYSSRLIHKRIETNTSHTNTCSKRNGESMFIEVLILLKNTVKSSINPRLNQL
ncbi:hypothetical protein BpHYR1_013648 [Brachionus plicatilis]|uniref:Uncharacterized protein n=1 Tax=Brachionus plicatilis TaxID=10195 RepID=A0A3M7SXW2_BRAPC|nr:hypothetical protein BpHYR1_013648 [Brachionus plicatilis]